LLARSVTPAADGSGNLTVSQLPPINLMGVNDGWVVDLPASGERVMQQPFVVGNVVIFVSEIPSGDPCNGGFTSFLYGLNALSGAGGMNFFSSNGVFYDAIKSPVAGITGLTVVIESGTSILTYGFGPNFGGGSDGGSGKPPGGTTGGPTGNPTTAPPQPPCPPNVDCNRSPLTNATGRISWHEMVQ
jgi:type IV pilus assembly protein PilY1